MGLIWLALGAIALWALIRLGRQGERPGRGHWRVAATILGAVMVAGGVLAVARGAWIAAVGLTGGGAWLIMASRLRPPAPVSREAMTEAEARAILGVEAGATPEQVHAAWRRVMARTHPDQGGTEGLAARVNAARDRLSRKG